MNIFITSDTHFSHTKIIELGRPPDYEEKIKKELIKRVKPDDILIHLGDICIGNDLENNNWFKKNLKCRTFLARGNHDRQSLEWYLLNGWDSVSDRLDLKFYGKTFCFTHEPIPWDGKYDLNIHGHLHDNGHREEEYQLHSRNKLISLEELKYKPKKFNINLTKKDMQFRLRRVWNKVKELGYNPYYIGLYGSQNYGLDTETSDFDFKAIILPTLDDLVCKTKPVSTVVDFEGGEIDIKDIRTYIESAIKVNVNFIEILSTEFYLGDKDIKKFFTPLLDELGTQYTRSLLGMAKMKYIALKHEYPSKEYEIKTYGYDPKQLHHIKRLRILAERYLKGNYSFKHTGKERLDLLKLKSGIYTLEEAEKIANKEIKKLEKIVDNYKKEDIYETKEKMVKFSQEIIKNCIKFNILI